MLINLYPIPFRYKLWYKRISARFLDQTIVNSWLVYQSKRDEYMPLYDFKTVLARQLLLGQDPTRTKVGRPLQSDDNINVEIFGPRKAQPHFVSKDERTENAKELPIYGEKVQRCRNKSQRKTFWFCKKCSVH